MGVHAWSFAGVAALVILAPGPDMTLVTKNALVHGRRAALATALGVNAGLLVWTIASALGLAALVRASAVAFTAFKLVGAAYLIWLGVLALRARSTAFAGPGDAGSGRTIGGLRGFRQGVISNIANPKIAVLFTSLVPQFVISRTPGALPFLLLGGLFVAMTLIWLCSYAVIAARAAGVLRRPRVARALDRVTGVVLIGLGLRVAEAHR